MARKILGYLDGNESLILVLGFVGAGIAQLFGHDVSKILASAFALLGWSDPEALSKAQATAALYIPLIWGLIAAGRSLWSSWKQRKAGAHLQEINSTAGYVRLAAADGTLHAMFPPPPAVVARVGDRRAWEPVEAPVDEPKGA